MSSSASDSESKELSATCAEYLQQYRDDYAEALMRGSCPIAAADRFSRVVDGLLGALYCAAEASVRIQFPDDTGHIALVAVGGYGRRLLGLRSDIDILFLCDDPGSPKVKALAEQVLYPLWNLGEDIGHVVRGVNETLTLAKEDLRTCTTLLDLRVVAGDRTLGKRLLQSSRRHIFGPRLLQFLNELELDTHKRHKRFGDSLHLLEPDVKSGRGGLRDFDVAIWAARARWGSTSVEHRFLEKLAPKGVLLLREVRAIRKAHSFLWRVRNLLHLRKGRQQDRLSFVDQEQIAESLGFEDDLTLGVEQFMQTYYKSAGVIAQATERLLEQARPVAVRRTRITQREVAPGIAEFDGSITFVDSARLQSEPILALRLYESVLKLQKPAYAFARNAVAQAAGDPEWCARLRDTQDSGRIFVRLMSASEKSGVRRSSLPSELHDVRLTTAMIPEMEALVGRVVHDVFHIYTFDVHAIRAVDRLRALLRGKRFEHLGHANRLAAELPRPKPLVLAALLHRLESRRIPASTMCAPIVRRLGLSGADENHVLWLLEERHTLYRWATRRDTSDPEVLEELAKSVESLERLRDLYLLTVAILSTTNPTAMTSWKARVLDDLFFALAMVLEGNSVSGRAATLRAEVAIGFVGDGAETELCDFVDGLPDRYVLANDPDVIRQHARTIRDGSPPVLALGPGPSDGVSELILWTEDRPGLLAGMCAVFAAHGIGIVGAQLYTQQGMAFDIFWVRRAKVGRVRDGERSRLDQKIRAKLDTAFREFLDGRATGEALVARAVPVPKWTVRLGPDVPTIVNIDNHASRQHTVIDVFTRDRVGVLHAIAQTLHAHGLTIALSKINTEGERVSDVFYVTDANKRKVENPKAAIIQQALLDSLEAIQPAA